MNECLNEEQIIKILKEYIESKNTDYAVLIDGNWGCGKTFFVENSIIKKFKEQEIEKDGKKKKIKFIYISVYGIKDIKEIDNKIFDSIIEDFLIKKVGKYHKIINKGFESVYDIVSVFKELPKIPKDSVRNLIEILQNQRNYIMVFDDIERSEIPISELLGYINDFVEHKKIKTILISNEKEILKKNLYTNAELKYIAVENEILDMPIRKDPLESIFERKNTQVNSEKVKLKIEDLNDRVARVFGEDNLYNQIKEKLIGITIYYEPNLENVAEAIINEYVVDEEVKKYIQNNKKVLINLMRNKNHVNLRTLKIAVNIMENVLVILYKLDLSKYEKKDIENCKKEIIRYTMASCIKYKDGEWKHTDRPDFFNIIDENNLNENYDGFKFIDDIIEKRFVDDSKIASVIELYIQSRAENVETYDDPINNLKYYWEMEDSEIEDNYRRLKEKLEKDIYKSSAYPKIIYRVFRLTSMGFSEQYIEDIINIMLDKLKKGENIEEYNELAELDFAFNDKEEKEKYDEIVKPIKDIMENSNKISRKEDINNTITDKVGWGEEFANYCLKNRAMFQSRKEFFNLIDIENLSKSIKTSATKDVSNFRRAVYTIYDFRNIKEFYENDLEKLALFMREIDSIRECEEFNKYDKSKKYNIDLLKKTIEEIVGKLKNN